MESAATIHYPLTLKQCLIRFGTESLGSFYDLMMRDVMTERSR